MSLRIEALRDTPDVRRMLGALLVDVVATGGSVSFMHPVPPETAEAFWKDALSAADRGERVVFGAWIDGLLVGTVSLLLDLPPNQPHRAEIAKMMTGPAHRGRGIASALLCAAEDEAVRRSRTLLVLDTATDGGASSLYERLGYTLAGEIPDFALKPHGGLTGTKLYWKRLAAG
jgi:ribosomal protein S18 acetylase RimI-like enzyme